MIIINYCPNCVGNPYTSNRSLSICPQCGTALMSEIASETELNDRMRLSDEHVRPWGDTDDDIAFNQDERTHTFGWPPMEEKAEEHNPDHAPTWKTEDDARDYPWNNANKMDVSDAGKGEGIAPRTPDPQDVAQRTGTDRLTSLKKSIHRTGIPQALPGDVAEGLVIGQVANYSNSSIEPGEYHRNIFQKIVDAIIYGQRTNDIIHRFMVRTDDEDPMGGGYRDIFVNVHGTIAGGMQLSDNQKVEVHGRYRDGVLVAKKIYILSGAGKTLVNFQHEIGGAALFGGLLLFAVFLFLGGFGNPSSMFGGVGAFLSEWLVMLVFAVIIWIFVLSKLGPLGRSIASSGGKNSLVGILVLSVVMTLIFTNTLGLGNAAGSAVDSILDYVIALSGPIITILLMLYGIYRMIKL